MSREDLWMNGDFFRRRRGLRLRRCCCPGVPLINLHTCCLNRRSSSLHRLILPHCITHLDHWHENGVLSSILSTQSEATLCFLYFCLFGLNVCVPLFVCSFLAHSLFLFLPLLTSSSSPGFCLYHGYLALIDLSFRSLIKRPLPAFCL